MSATNESYLVLTPGISGADGVARLSRQVVQSLRELSDHVEVWSFIDEHGDAAALERAGVRVRAAGRSKTRLATWALAGLATSFRDVVVVVMHAHLAPLSLPLVWRGARVVQILLGVEVWKPLSPLQARAFRNARPLVAISAHTARRFSEANPGFAPPVVCHPGLADVSPEKAGPRDGERFALTVGRMSSEERYKGHDQLLSAWPLVRDEVPDATLVIVGGGDDRDRLAHKAESLGLGNAVRFAGTVSDEELVELYRQCAFFVMPSTDEGFGLVFLEAMQAAKACIGGIGAAAEIIEHGTTGLVVDPADESSVRHALVELFRDETLATQMGAAGRARFTREFTSAAHGERLKAALARPRVGA